MRTESERRATVIAKHAMKLLLVASLLLLAWVVPAVATHIQEPTTPITGLRLKVWEYQTPNIVDCSIVQDVAFDALRIDSFVLAEGAPSEHFTVQIGAITIAPGVPSRTVAAAQWAHQNAPPHTPTVLTSGWYGFWMSVSLLEHTGLWYVTVAVIGDESGRQFTQTCMFRKV